MSLLRFLLVFAALAAIALLIANLWTGPQQPLPVCIDNPRADPDSDASGPRASEQTTDATPYAGTPGTNQPPCPVGSRPR